MDSELREQISCNESSFEHMAQRERLAKDARYIIGFQRGKIGSAQRQRLSAHISFVILTLRYTVLYQHAMIKGI